MDAHLAFWNQEIKITLRGINYYFSEAFVANSILKLELLLGVLLNTRLPSQLIAKINSAKLRFNSNRVWELTAGGPQIVSQN